MMGIALGGLGVLSLKLPRDVSLEHLVDLPTLLLAAFLVAILALIGYFTNPSEASFRTFLTELAFRQHLSRLSEAQDGEHEDNDDDTRLARPIDYKGPRKKGAPTHTHTPHHDSPVVFHFANKASVSLRTPGYRFRSFAVLTFAIVAPTELALAGAQPPRAWSNPAQHGAWFIGAFGHWWLGFEMRMHPRHVRLAAHDDATSVPAHDNSPPRPAEDREREHTPTRPLRVHTHARAAPRTKAALRERLSLHTGPPRPTTPPPLPKSASLPLHGPPPAPPLLPSAASSPAPAPSPAPTPALADMLAQLEAARAVNADLQTQLTAFRAPLHETLHASVEAARETKKNEDAGRAAVKARTKALDDARRQADAGKREAEKRLKAAAAARDGTTDRIERLGRDIGALLERMAADAARVTASAEESAKERTELTDALAEKRTEIVEAEDAVSVLAARVRDLEGAIAAETTHLETLKTRARNMHVPTDTSAWPPPLVSPRPPPLALGGLSNLGNGNGNGTVNSQLNVTASAAGLDTPFSPFSESPSTGPLSPGGAGLLPSSLVQSMESPRAPGESFFGSSQARPVLQQEHGAGYTLAHVQYGTGHGNGNGNSSGNGSAYGFSSAPTSPIDPPPPNTHFDSQRAVFPPRVPLPAPAAADDDAGSRPRRWFSVREKGLNPAAKVFTLPRARRLPASDFPGDTPANTPFSSDTTPFPSDTAPTPPAAPATAFFAALHSAFAPSPAEREVFQRALGDASLERVSSRGSAGGSAHSSPLVPPARAWDAAPSAPSHRAAFFNPWPAKEGA